MLNKTTCEKYETTENNKQMNSKQPNYQNTETRCGGKNWRYQTQNGTKLNTRMENKLNETEESKCDWLNQRSPKQIAMAKWLKDQKNKMKLKKPNYKNCCGDPKA